MIVTTAGKYTLLKDIYLRTSAGIKTLRKGTVINVDQVDQDYHKVIGPELEDWQFWDLPLKETR